MDGLVSLVLRDLPTGIFIVVGVAVLWFRLNDISKELRDIKKGCEKRLTWCLDHFRDKQD